MGATTVSGLVQLTYCCHIPSTSPQNPAVLWIFYHHLSKYADYKPYNQSPCLKMT